MSVIIWYVKPDILSAYLKGYQLAHPPTFAAVRRIRKGASEYHSRSIRLTEAGKAAVTQIPDLEGHKDWRVPNYYKLIERKNE